MRSRPAEARSTGKGAPVEYKAFIDESRAFVAQQGLDWSIPLNDDGSPITGSDWDLRRLTGSTSRNASRVNGFAVHKGMRLLAEQAGWSAALLPQDDVLENDAQEFIRAMVAWHCRKKFQPRVVTNYALIYRKFFSTTRKKPWLLANEDFDRFCELVPKDSKALTVVSGLAKRMNENMLSVSCPLEPKHSATSTFEMLRKLNERKGGDKLPSPEAFYELARIVFQESPRSHQDVMRFCMCRLLILTGLRVGEILLLPADCLRWEDHVDVVTGKPGGECGGVSKSLRLRYFAEKTDEGTPDILVEKEQWIPGRFHEAVAGAVQMARDATQRLRQALREQFDMASPPPRSDLRWFLTDSGERLNTADLLFLVLKGRSLALPKQIRRSAAVAAASLSALYSFIGVKTGAGPTVFMNYGRGADVKSMRVKPHSLRHLMNTELFRLNVADTVITHQFGRTSVAHSYEYDHRSLSERLQFVSLPDEARGLIRPGSPQEVVTKMVVGGLVPESHIAKAFKSIQAERGDAPAFRFLAASADGFHVTPYGFCITSFSVNPCPKHLKCFDKCKCYVPSGWKEHRVSLERLRENLRLAQKRAVSQKAHTCGARNQIAHVRSLLSGVTAALSAQPSVPLFPAGCDHSAPVPDLLA